MNSEYTTWSFTDEEHYKFETWIDRINQIHTGNADLRNNEVHITSPKKDLSDCKVGLFTTGGVHLKSDTPFDVTSEHGDPTYRTVDMTTSSTDLMITHTHYNHVEADKDINCIFPIDRLRELKDQGIIGDIAPYSYNIMGFNPDPSELINKTAPTLAEKYSADGVDLLFMTCG